MKMSTVLSIREIQHSDIPAVVNYWTSASDAHLRGMGVDLEKMLTAEQFSQMLEKNINTPIEQRISCCVIWEADGKPVGHSNTNPTKFGEEAFMHLHLWNSDSRKKGLGTDLVRLSLSYYFGTLKLKRLFCEPYALNPAPNKTLEKVGFEFVKEYITTPGYLNFEQPVKRWLMSRERFEQLNNLSV
jgi:RimJ/RimL family protein N-acetyltransferase